MARIGSVARIISALASGTGALLAFGLATPLLAQPFQTQGMDFLANVTLAQFGVPGGNGNDCWGYVSPGGREYAIMGLSDRVSFVDISNPTAPVIVASVPHTSSTWAGIKVYQRYCYVSNESGGGVQVIDMGNIDAGSVTLVRSVTANGLNTAHTLALNEASGYLYVCGSNVTGSGGSLVAFSLADASNPTYAGQWSGPYTHEAQVVTYTSGPFAGQEVAFCYNGRTNFAIVNVTNKAAMTQMSALVYPGLQYCHQGWLSEDRRYVYLNDELDGPGQGFASSETRVIDVSNLNAPVVAGTFAGSASGAIDHNNYVRGRYVYQSNYRSGMRVFDLGADPIHPPEVAWIDTYPEDDGAEFDGTWSNYPYFPSGTIVVSDINRGMFLTRLNLDYIRVEFVGTPPVRVNPGVATPITASVTTNLTSGGTPVDPSSVRLHARVNGGSFTSILMTSIGSNQYRASLPVAPCGATVAYYVSAANTAGRTFSVPVGGASSPIVAEVYSSESVVLSYTMESDAGWARDAAGDTATAGLWERGDPEGTAAQPADDHTGAPGVNCWVTGRLAGTGVGSFDVDGGLTTLLSPVFNLAGASGETRIGYWRWYNNAAGAAPNADTFRVDISNNNGASWVNAETVGPAGAEVSGGWLYHQFRVVDVLPLTANVRVRFIAEDVTPGSIIEAAVDDFVVFARTCTPPCVADVDDGTGGGFPDGGVTIDDLLYYLSVFEAGALRADVDDGTSTGTPDGGVTIDDLLYFLVRFENGC